MYLVMFCPAIPGGFGGKIVAPLADRKSGLFRKWDAWRLRWEETSKEHYIRASPRLKQVTMAFHAGHVSQHALGPVLTSGSNRPLYVGLAVLLLFLSCLLLWISVMKSISRHVAVKQKGGKFRTKSEIQTNSLINIDNEPIIVASQMKTLCCGQ